MIIFPNILLFQLERQNCVLIAKLRVDRAVICHVVKEISPTAWEQYQVCRLILLIATSK